jgi:hypothetical protein
MRKKYSIEDFKRLAEKAISFNWYVKDGKVYYDNDYALIEDTEEKKELDDFIRYILEKEKSAK